MKRAQIEFLAGVFVLVGIAALTYLAISLGGVKVNGNDTYEVEARFTDISGVSAGSPVKIAGVPVGEVSAIRLDRKSMVAIATLRLPADLVLYDDTIAAVRTNGLIGDKVIVLRPGGSGIELAPGDMIVDTESAVDIEGLISKIAFGKVES